MMRYLDKLNLRPNERRIVVAAGFFFFIMLNYLLVWPHFKDWSINAARKKGAEAKLAMYNAEIAHKPAYQARVAELMAAGGNVAPENQQLQFDSVVYQRAVESGVNATYNGRVNTATNEFFLKQEKTMRVIAREKPLVNFLVDLSDGNSLMRVRSLRLSPEEPAHINLTADITIEASYQKNPVVAAKAAAPAPKTAPATAKPAAVADKPNATPGRGAPSPWLTNFNRAGGARRNPFMTNSNRLGRDGARNPFLMNSNRSGQFPARNRENQP